MRAVAAAALALLAVWTLGGCASLQSAAVASAMDRMMPGQPVVNSYTFHRMPWGTWAVLSVWRVTGPQPASETKVLDTWALDGIGHVELVVPGPDAERLQGMLFAETPGCGSPHSLLAAAARGVAMTMRFLEANPDRAPRIRLLVIPPGQGHAGLDVSMSGAVHRLQMTIAKQLPESRDCMWLRYWAAETLQTLYHEMFHAWNLAKRGQPSDLLHEEFVAYAIGDCAIRLSDPEQRPRLRTFPGLDHLPTQTIIDAARQGRIPPTIAGRYLAHLQGPAQDRTPGDGWRVACAGLADDYPTFDEP